MKKTLLLLALAGMLWPLQAQTSEELEPEAGARISVAADKKLSRGLHVGLEEEVRIDDNFASFNRMQTTLWSTYKPLSYLKLGAGYCLIMPYSDNNGAFKSVRHRLMLDVQGSHRHANWQFTLKERLQFTHRTGNYNPYQNPSTAITLKSRLKVSYRGLHHLTPYAYAEMRTYLNAPVVHASYDGSHYLTPAGNEEGEAGWFLEGFDGVYNNRYRFALGADYRIDRHNSLSAYLLLDLINDKVLDANAEGTKLKSYTRQQGVAAWIGLDYQYRF